MASSCRPTTTVVASAWSWLFPWPFSLSSPRSSAGRPWPFVRQGPGTTRRAPASSCPASSPWVLPARPRGCGCFHRYAGSWVGGGGRRSSYSESWPGCGGGGREAEPHQRRSRGTAGGSHSGRPLLHTAAVRTWGGPRLEVSGDRHSGTGPTAGWDRQRPYVRVAVAGGEVSETSGRARLPIGGRAVRAVPAATPHRRTGIPAGCGPKASAEQVLEQSMKSIHLRSRVGRSTTGSAPQLGNQRGECGAGRKFIMGCGWSARAHVGTGGV